MNDDNKKTVFDVSVSFYGLIGRQRKIQHQLITHDTELEEEPTDEYAEEIARQLLADNKARKIQHSVVSVTIQKSKLELRGNGIACKSTMLFSDDHSKRFQITI